MTPPAIFIRIALAKFGVIRQDEPDQTRSQNIMSAIGIVEVDTFDVNKDLLKG